MSSSERQSQGSVFSASSSEARRDTQGNTTLPEQVSSTGEHMKQQTDSTTEMVSSHVSSLDTDPTTTRSNADGSSDTNSFSNDSSRPLPIPPASEPMQYRAIGLIYGKYVPSEEQFTRGNLVTENDQEIDSVLLGRVMSLVKKHIDLEEPHLWVVYPRTRSKDSYLHAQIVGIWEPDKLNRNLDDELDDDDEMDSAQSADDEGSVDSEENVGETPSQDKAGHSALTASEDGASEDGASEDGASEDGDTEALASEDDSEQEQEEVSAVPAAAKASQDVSTEDVSTEDVSAEEPEQTAPAVKKPMAPAQGFTQKASESKSSPLLMNTVENPEEILKDGYFSIRGEVLKASPDDDEVTVKIRQAPRKGSNQPRAFNLTLKGKLEGRTVGYFWDLNVQRVGTDLVVQDGAMIGLVPPSKRKKGFKKGRGGPRGQGGHPGKRRFNTNSRGQGDRQGPKRPPVSKPQKRSREQSQSNSPSN